MPKIETLAQIWILMNIGVTLASGLMVSFAVRKFFRELREDSKAVCADVKSSWECVTNILERQATQIDRTTRPGNQVGFYSTPENAVRASQS